MHPGLGIPSLLTWGIGAGQLLFSEVVCVLVPRCNPRTAAVYRRNHQWGAKSEEGAAKEGE